MTVRGSFLEGFGVTFGTVWALWVVFGTHFWGRKTDEHLIGKKSRGEDPTRPDTAWAGGSDALKEC